MVQDRARQEVTAIRRSYEAAVAGVLALAEKDLRELRTYTSPPAAVEAVLAAVCVALGVPSDWTSVHTLLNHSHVSVFARIEAFDLASVRPARAAQLERMLVSPDLQPERVVAVSAAAHSLAAWVRAVHAHSQVDGIRARERAELRELLQQQDMLQVAPRDLLQGNASAERAGTRCRTAHEVPHD